MSTDATTLTILAPATNPAVVYVASLAPGSRRTATQALNVIADLLGWASCDVVPWHLLRFSHTQALRQALASRYALTTANKMLSFLRQVMKTAWRLELMIAEDYHRAADVANISGERLPAGRALAMGEITALMRVCGEDPHAAGARDAALIALLTSTGMRRSEVVALSYHATPTTTLRITEAKGRKDRDVPLVGTVRQTLTDWIAVRGVEPGPLFTRMTQHGACTLDPITAHAVYTILKKRGKEAGVESFSPHDLRRTVVSMLLTQGTDANIASKLVGHKDVRTTLRYDRRGYEAVEQAVQEKIHIPYFGRPAKEST